MPEISESELKSYIADRAEKERLAAKNEKMQAAAENTKVALKANREEIKTLKEEKEELETTVETVKKEKEEIESKYEGFDEKSEAAEKWAAHEAKMKEDREAQIEEMKTKLGEEFMEANKDFLEGLPDDKVESYLKKNVEALDDGGKPPVETGTPAGGMKPNAGTNHTTDFDTAIEKGDAMAALEAMGDPL